MKVRTKLVMLSAVLVVVYGSGLLGILGHLIATRFLEVEQSFAHRDMERVTQALHRETEALGTLATDWANWDDAWLYTQGKNPNFERVNLNKETLENGRLAFVAIYNAKGQRCKAVAFNPERGLSDFEYFPDQIPTEGLPEFRSVASGIIQTPSGLMLTYSSKIMKSDRSGPSGGFLVMGRKLDTAMLGALSNQTGVHFEYTLPGHPTPEIPVTTFSEEGTRLEPDPNSKVIHGFNVFRTTQGAPALIVRTTTERPIAQAGKSIALFIGGFSLLLAAIVWGIVSIAFRQWVSRPLAQIESSLDTLNLDDVQTKNPFSTLPAGPNEIGHIILVLKGMYERMLVSHSTAKNLNEHLESEVASRTKDFVLANQRLGLYGKVLESTSEGMLITDMNGTILEVNDAMCQQSGYTREQLVGQNPRIFKSGQYGADFYQNLWSTLCSTGHWSGEIWDRRQDGELYPKLLTINTLVDAEAKPTHYVGLSVDISLMKSAEERMHELAYYDQLTRLPNRSMFNDHLRRSILQTQRKNVLSALLFLDLDRFKKINDTLGHTVGDALLVCVAERITKRLRGLDTVCRMGGDEFSVILGEITNLEDAGRVASDLIELLTKRFDIEGTEIYVGASIGIALCPRDGKDVETLIKKADAAMYTAKEAGRCTYRFASEELDTIRQKRLEIESKLHGAVERNEMVMFYQPLTRAEVTKAGSPSGLVGAEALVRWVPEPGVIVGPGTFIEIAEDSGLILEIGEWVLRESCREAKRWCNAGLQLTVSVNVSSRQLEDDRFRDIVRSALEEAALPPQLLRLEVTESAFMRNMDRVVGVMDDLRNSGVNFSIDDFGTGYSSLQYIKCLPANNLKIDKAFVSGVAANLSDAEIVSAIIAMARAFGLKSTAEGVETEDQLRELRDRGCDVIQGYLVAKPMPADAFMAFATQGVGTMVSEYK